MKKTEDAKSLLVIVTGLIVLHFIFEKAQTWILVAAVTIGLLSIFIPIAGSLIVKGWMLLAEVLGTINGRILLSLIFFLVLVPVALMSRLRRKNLLMLKNDDSGSVFTDRNHLYTSKDLENVW